MMSNNPAPAPGNPTPSQIAQVIQNLRRMQKLNDAIYNNGWPLFGNAFGLLSCNDNSDLGLVVGLNLMEGVIDGIGGELGPLGAFTTTFLSGMLSEWATSAPSSLANTFGGLELRLQAMTTALDDQLATYAGDVPTYWNYSFSYGANTVTLSGLADIVFPAEIDTAFGPLRDAGVFALDQWIWRSVLQQRYVVTQFQSPGFFPSCGQPTNCAIAYYQKNPAYFVTWYWGLINQGPSIQPLPPENGWCFNAANLGTGVDRGFNEGIPFQGDGGLNVPACNYLFIDSIPGTAINSAGLFTRFDVFNNLGIPTASHASGPPGAF